jgi:GNAT superfamily N-acetyltransferase
VYGLPEQWPHVADLLRRVGFSRGGRTEIVLLADVAELPRRPRPSGLRVERTLGTVGTRLAAVRDDCVVGYVEVDTGIGGSGAIAGRPGWADVCNLSVREADRGRGVGSWLLGEAAEWLRLGRVDRLLAYADPGETGFLERCGFRRLTETVRDWNLPA